MKPQELIESYIDDVALHLPRELRNDVGLELRTLLGDQLEAAATAAGRAPDEEMTTAMLRHFGRPEDVAGRYRPRGFTLIEPEHGPLFVKLAAVCMALQWTLTLPLLLTGRMTSGEWWLICFWGALWWPGALVVYFSAATWIRRRWPADPETFARPGVHWLFWLPDIEDDWRPIDRRVQPGGIGPAIVGALATILFMSPIFIDRLMPASVDISWARFDADFQRWLLVPLVALIAARLSLYVLAVVNERWRSRTERIRIVLWIAFVGLLFWALFGWEIFASDLTDTAFKVWLFVFLLVNCLLIGGWMRRFMARVRIPKQYAQ
jgi:hypothetical protein